MILEKDKVAKIIREAMKNNDKCKTCEFVTQCFFAYDCLSTDYSYWIEKFIKEE